MLGNKKSTLTLIAAISLAAPALYAQEIDIRLSIKYILDASNNRPPGWYATEQNIRDVIDETNVAMQRFGRGYRFVIVGTIDEVREDQTPGSNSTSFFNINETGGPANEIVLLETAARNDPVGYHWRSDAVNVFVVNCCAAQAIVPTDGTLPSGYYGAAFYSADVNFTPDRNAQKTIWLHELGHHFNLYHTWDADEGVSDTRPDANPNQCTTVFGCTNGGSNECCCSTKANNLEARANSQGWTQQEFEDLRYNVMSYYNATDCPGMNECLATLDFRVNPGCGPDVTNGCCLGGTDNCCDTRLTNGQLDRFTDATRLYHSNEVTGLTYFVDKQNTTAPFNGYSSDPYQTVQSGITAAAADRGVIVNIRAGSYPENLLIQTPITLRANRGLVTIGQ